ncbi:glycosyltransferase [Devosia chinhatensis]|uniref:glycosyltransferase n=1 Tax=Devosia chinhatensis TaxID=429727 RepID=UPI000697F17E|nr:glycosyltransferase [Devosia chinhatensis]
MSDTLSLMTALIGADGDPQDASALLDEALLAEVDPLHFCALYLRLDPALVMERAAAWLGLAFYATLPPLALPTLAPTRLEVLAEVRMFRMRMAGTEIAFAAPDFFGLLRLRKVYESNPELRRHVCIVPQALLGDLLVQAAEEALVDGARQTLAKSWPHAAAQLDLTRPVRWSFAIGLMLLVVMALLAPLAEEMLLLPIWVLLVVAPILLRMAMLLTPNTPPFVAPKGGFEDDLPLYTILVPLRDEANMVGQLCVSLGRLDYPREKLEILFVVESRSPDTIAAVRERLHDARFGLVVVPDAPPRTKPKALNFALPLCRGEFVVVFDAEDRPEPGQLRQVVAQFRQQPDVHCIQARLVIGNGTQGPLAALFAGDYAGLFTVTLPALARWGAVMPLGGTSNHFRLATLRELGGWDGFNVTEDADLGVRLARRTLRTATSASVTYEDAPTNLKVWLGQRTRWMKGWLQTFAVHNRRPRRLLADLGWRAFCLFQVTILGMVLAPLLHTAFAGMLAFRLITGTPSEPVTSSWALACLVIFACGYGLASATNFIGLSRTAQSGLGVVQLLLPVYWLLVAFATLRAMVEFLHRPFHWWKTPHQVTRPPQPRPPRDQRPVAVPSAE